MYLCIYVFMYLCIHLFIHAWNVCVVYTGILQYVYNHERRCIV